MISHMDPLSNYLRFGFSNYNTATRVVLAVDISLREIVFANLSVIMAKEAPPPRTSGFTPFAGFKRTWTSFLKHLESLMTHFKDPFFWIIFFWLVNVLPVENITDNSDSEFMCVLIQCTN